MDTKPPVNKIVGIKYQEADICDFAHFGHSAFQVSPPVFVICKILTLHKACHVLKGGTGRIKKYMVETIF